MSLPLGFLTEAVKLLSQIPPEVIPHVIDFVRAVISGDQEAAKRAATLATTEQIFDSPKKL